MKRKMQPIKPRAGKKETGIFSSKGSQKMDKKVKEPVSWVRGNASKKAV